MKKIKQYTAKILLGIIERIYLDKPYNDKASRLIDRLIIASGK